LLNDHYTELKEENEALKKQLVDLTYLLDLREEELAEVKNNGRKIGELESKLESHLYELETFQNYIEHQQRQKEKHIKIAAALEEEMISSLNAEKMYYQMKEAFESNKIAVMDLQEEIREFSGLHKEIDLLRLTIRQLESQLEISLLDNQFLKETIQDKK